MLKRKSWLLLGIIVSFIKFEEVAFSEESLQPPPTVTGIGEKNALQKEPPRLLYKRGIGFTGILANQLWDFQSPYYGYFTGGVTFDFHYRLDPYLTFELSLGGLGVHRAYNMITGDRAASYGEFLATIGLRVYLLKLPVNQMKFHPMPFLVFAIQNTLGFGIKDNDLVVLPTVGFHLGGGVELRLNESWVFYGDLRGIVRFDTHSDRFGGFRTAIGFTHYY